MEVIEMAESKFRWINDEVKIDFPVTKLMANTMKEAKELDLENNIEYTHVADAIDLMCKECVVNKLMTQEQWDKMVDRYPVV
jgi:hypothetical protein